MAELESSMTYGMPNVHPPGDEWSPSSLGSQRQCPAMTQPFDDFSSADSEGPMVLQGASGMGKAGDDTSMAGLVWEGGAAPGRPGLPFSTGVGCWLVGASSAVIGGQAVPSTLAVLAFLRNAR